MKINENVEEMIKSRTEKIENELTRLWLEAKEMTNKWQPQIVWLVTGSVGLHPWDCEEKVCDKNGRFKNIRLFESDDDLAADYSDFQMAFWDWTDRLSSWLSKVSPRFRNRFDDVVAETERFSKQFDEQYVYVGDVSELLALYDNFCKKKAAVDDLSGKLGSKGWEIKGDDDVAFELTFDEDEGLYLNDYKIHSFRYVSDFENVLREALNDKNDMHTVKIDRTKIRTSALQSNIGMLKIPRELRKLMFRTSKGNLIVKPQISYGDLKRADIDDVKIANELRHLYQKT